MPTLNTSKYGVGTSQASATFTTTRENASTVSTNLTGTSQNIQYLATAGRGSLTHQIKRVFLYFDTSGLTGTISNTSINIVGVNNESADVIVLKSTAFGGDGNSNLASSEYFSSIDFSTVYSSEYDSWTATGTNDISLNSTANTDIQNNDAFICAIVEHSHDYGGGGGSAASTATSNQAGVNFNNTITLTYTEAASSSGPANLTSLNGIAKASITSANTITLANITSINTIA